MFKAITPCLFLVSVLFVLTSCGGEQKNEEARDKAEKEEADPPRVIPSFNADSAYHYVEKQVSFGPRVPNTNAHRECGNWLQGTLERFADTVYVQNTRVRAYDGTVLQISNFIGSFSPEKRSRILLAAHWDTRPWADHDPDPENHYSPFDGANDGASGVGVLLELARLLSHSSPDVGVDIVLFDAEDYGLHREEQGPDRDSWALGSQHWAQSPHRSDYDARFGILLDMVGAQGATFLHEGYSLLYAPHVVRKVWEIAQRIGYGHFFLNREGGYIMDDHYYVNEIRNIPTINIIDQRSGTPHGFFEHWHTMQDNMDVIDPATLEAVGQTVLTVIFRE